MGINIIYEISQYTVGNGFANLGLSDYLMAILAVLQHIIIRHPTNHWWANPILTYRRLRTLQFGALPISRIFWYLLALMLVWAAYLLYKTLFGNKDSNKAGTATADAAGDDSKQNER